ncbi:hypothetical protein [Niveispirillum fermenti]|uniref:hypothetical protein n=1 Tax=Niveispirillum fermenti TaxID=1233113 RepID=UPI003A87E199
MTDFSQEDAALVALAAMPDGSASPIQIMKMLFLIDRKASPAFGGPKFNFVPYDYGPFDRSVYDAIDNLATKGLVSVATGRPRTYRLTSEGKAEAAIIADRLQPAFLSYFHQLGKWIVSLGFTQLVSAIYREFPDMRVNSVFRE